MATMWTEIATHLTEEKFGELRDGVMCCCNTYCTKRRPTCALCGGLHEMVERRFECGSIDCYRAAVELQKLQDQVNAEDENEVVVVPKQGGKKSCCPTIFKVLQCTAFGWYRVLVNDRPHVRGSEPCTVAGNPRLTDAMREFIAKEDRDGSAPRNICTKMQEDKAFEKPSRGWPKPKQIANALNLCEMVYTPGIDPSKTFLFGPLLADDGHAHVGTGEDDDPFILGITSVALLQNCAKYMSSHVATVFHADATFKLSDLGYPVITCGFTDHARSYQLAAIFVVSRRTTLDYMRCFNALMSRFRDIGVRMPKIEFVMGDAEDAQYTAVQGVPELAGATVLMCFFHVLYNVRKKIQHLNISLRKKVMLGILDMHFSTDLKGFWATRDRVVQEWRSASGLATFAKYFEQQWLNSRYWRWQAFHTPSGYAATNNPCEVFNASLKSYFKRRRCHMELLLRKLREVIAVTPINPPAAVNFVPTPSTDVSTAAKAMLTAGKLKVIDTDSKEIVRVYHVSARPTDQRVIEQGTPNPTVDADAETDDDEEFFAACDVDEEVEPLEANPTETTVEDESTPIFVGRNAWEVDVDAEKAREAAKKLYTNVVKWSIKYSHRVGQPHHGWTVDINRCVCNCRFFAKFAMCAHVVAVRLAKRLPKPGVQVVRLFKNRIVAKRKMTKKTQKASQGSAKKTRGAHTSGAPASDTATTPAHPMPPRPTLGRPPLAAPALDIQFLLC